MIDANNPDGTGGILSVDDAAARLMAAPEPAPEADKPEPSSPEPDDAPEADEPDADPSDDADTQDEPEPEPAKPQTFKVKVNGEEVEVTQDELLNGYSRQADYTRRTQELARQRQEMEAARSQIQQQAQQYQAQLAQAMQIAQAFMPAPPPRELADTDPLEFMRQKTAYDEQAAKIQHLQAEHARVSQQTQAQQQQQLHQYLEQQRNALVEAVPELKEPAKRTAFQQELVNTLGEAYGFAAQEIGNVYDHRLILLARDAMAYRKLQAQKPKTEAKVAKAPPMVKPGTRPSTAEARAEAAKAAKAAVKRSGSMDDAVAYLLGKR